ncbi:MAG: hypothetical protein JHC95_08340 [Solirubrobacteraceae bacterium]|nr:hypothetical protein [Solirubrobacteraceae bacterium]
MQLRAAPDSSAPLEFISYKTEYGADGVGELVCHVRGEAEDLDAAATSLTNSGRRNLQLIALSANAAVLDPHLEAAYEPIAGGAFVALRTLGGYPVVARRTIDVDRTLRLIQAFAVHPRETRLLRATANYGEALRRTGPAASVHALLHLWMAVESLTIVVADRAKAEAGVESIPALGQALNIKPRPGRDQPNDGDVFSALRLRDIFAGDETIHRALREASNGIEHGYLSFGDARVLVGEIFEQAARGIRDAILRESGLSKPDATALRSGAYERPLPAWRPIVVATGSWAPDTDFDFEQPVHLRVDGSIHLAKVDPLKHATEANLDSQVRTLDGLEHRLDRVSLGAPGSRGGADR